ncbi:Centromere protein W [Microtus ochrogaster]|uniref:Centromere protein W n=1 Tax=Microtus ochrogaster TaxID=79684 RepID=A0A8J6L3M1_MICOH|nr:Centromere protein W [Microtus ochrogaster]
MALSTTVSHRIKRKAPRAFLRRTFKQKKPHLRLETGCDLLVSGAPCQARDTPGTRQGQARPASLRAR